MYSNKTTEKPSVIRHNSTNITTTLQNCQGRSSGLSCLLKLDTKCSDDIFWQEFKQLIDSHAIIDALCCDEPEPHLPTLTEADKPIITQLRVDTILNNNLSVCVKINKLLQTAYSQCYKINSQRRRNSYHPYYQINANKSQTDKLKFFNRNIGYNPQYLPCENMSDNELWAAFTYINHEYSIITLDNWNAWRPLNSNAPITFVNLYNKEFGDITRNLFKILNLKYPDNLRNFELYMGTKLHHSITNRLKIYMQTQYTLQTAAINIQHKFREYRKNYNHIINSTSTIKFALTLKLKTRIIKHMELLNKQIKFSETADAIQKFSETELYYNSIYNPIYNSIINNPITNATTENLKQILAHGITTSNLLCNDLAMALAILIRADNQLTIEIKQNTHVCKVGGHVMCCIGKPNDPNSIIIDPWIRYLNLYPTTGYRDITVLHNAPNRIGFIGTVAQYKSFLQAHPNKYVPRNSDLTITIHPQFSENTKSISPSDIRLDSMLL